MKEQTREEPTILAAAERRMQAWVLSAEIEGRAIRAEGPRRMAAQSGRYLSISREAGTGGGEVAQAVGRALGWEVLDKNLLDRVAERFACPRCMLELVDETESNWVYDVLGTWMDRKIITHDKYVSLLGRVVLAAVRRNNVVLVGRGAQFLLPREKGLAVRLIAPKRYRVARLIEREGFSKSDAARRVDEIDRGRHDFAMRFFHQDIDDPHLYDMVINVEHLGPDGAARQILATFHRP